MNRQTPMGKADKFKINPAASLRPNSVADTRILDADTEASYKPKLKIKNIGNEISAGGYTMNRGTGIPSNRLNKVKLDISMVDNSIHNNSIVTVTPSSDLRYIPLSKQKMQHSYKIE